MSSASFCAAVFSTEPPLGRPLPRLPFPLFSSAAFIVFLHHAETQQHVADIPVDIRCEFDVSARVVVRESPQHFHPAFQFQIHKTLWMNPVSFCSEECVDPIIEIALILMQIKENVFDLMGFLGQADKIVPPARF